MYIYKSYGLVFKSPIPLPLYPLKHSNCNPEVDVEVVCERVVYPPRHKHYNQLYINGIIKADVYSDDGKNFEVIHGFPSGFKSYIGFGNKIILEGGTDFWGNINHLNGFLYATLTAVVHTRGYFPFHASCLLAQNKGIMCIGKSGAGKSTLSLELLKSYNAKFLSDDVCRLDIIDDKLYALPGNPYIKIKEDVFQKEFPKELNSGGF